MQSGRTMAALGAALCLVLIMACGPSAELRQRVAQADTLAAQRDSLLQELALSARLVSDVSAELASVQLRGAKLKVSRESPSAAARDSLVQKIRYVVTRMNDAQARLRDGQRRMRALSQLSDSLRAALEGTVANLQSVIDNQHATIATLTAEVDTLRARNVALTDTVQALTTRENTVYYVIGTKEELLQRGIVVEEGGSRVLFILWKRGATLQPAHDLDPTDFVAVDLRQATEIPLPHRAGEYRIVSRQDPSALATPPNPHGKITGTPTLRIAAPEAFWQASRFLIVVQEKPGGPGEERRAG